MPQPPNSAPWTRAVVTAVARAGMAVAGAAPQLHPPHGWALFSALCVSTHETLTTALRGRQAGLSVDHQPPLSLHCPSYMPCCLLPKIKMGTPKPSRSLYPNQKLVLKCWLLKFRWCALGVSLHSSRFFFFFLMFIYLAAPGLSRSMWDLVSRPGIKPRPPSALECGVLATGPPGKSLYECLRLNITL